MVKLKKNNKLIFRVIFIKHINQLKIIFNFGQKNWLKNKVQSEHFKNHISIFEFSMRPKSTIKVLFESLERVLSNEVFTLD